MPETIVPPPKIIYPPEQYFDANGMAYHLCRIYGRLPAVAGRDSLRVSARGETRDLARANALNEWDRAYRAVTERSLRVTGQLSTVENPVNTD